MSQPVLEFRRLSVRYGEALALADVDLAVHPGEVVAVLGANGAGKSTLGSAASGLVRSHSGTVHIDAVDVTEWPVHRRARSGIAHVPELRGVFTGLSVLDNLKAGTVRLGRRQQREAIARAFALFPILADRRKQNAGTLSGGERQMLALARVLSSPPRLLIADEMSLGLAPRLVAEVFDGLRRVREEGVAVLLVEQYVDRAVAIADRAVILRRGRLVWEGPAGQATDEVRAHYLGDEASDAANYN